MRLSPRGRAVLTRLMEMIVVEGPATVAFVLDKHGLELAKAGSGSLHDVRALVTDRLDPIVLARCGSESVVRAGGPSVHPRLVARRVIFAVVHPLSTSPSRIAALVEDMEEPIARLVTRPPAER